MNCAHTPRFAHFAPAFSGFWEDGKMDQRLLKAGPPGRQTKDRHGHISKRPHTVTATSPLSYRRSFSALDQLGPIPFCPAFAGDPRTFSSHKGSHQYHSQSTLVQPGCNAASARPPLWVDRDLAFPTHGRPGGPIARYSTTTFGLSCSTVRHLRPNRHALDPSSSILLRRPRRSDTSDSVSGLSTKPARTQLFGSCIIHKQSTPIDRYNKSIVGNTLSTSISRFDKPL
ncbi:hypothetical protein AC578_7920 [Pseudocercospora eumusae]|uniref:Uncharacterized protein n=1 Tax=Pseudocercospora eumusae TaxID=321146 RepID=A0A139HPB0_9PEZI|nr:hypothetical protein AC578_7920 [Pseudocercospora eumusae]